MKKSSKTTERAPKIKHAQQQFTKDTLVKRIELVVAIIGLVAAIIGVVGVFIQTCLPLAEKSCFPILSPTPACIRPADVLVKFRVLDKNNNLLATLAPTEVVSLEPGVMVYFQPEVTSTSGNPLPRLGCEWTNLGMVTNGKLGSNTGCNIVDYQTGSGSDLQDTITMQLSQADGPACPMIGSYFFFITPKP